MNEEDLIESFKKELFEFTDSPERCSDKAVSPESKITKQGYYKSVVRVADTPSPAIKRKFLKDKKHKLGKYRNKKPTPSKKGKKLLNREVQLNVDDTLPGGRPSDAGMNLVRTQNTPRGLLNATPNTQQTPSSLFKPKSKMNFNEDEGGCDLSYESLQRQQRKRQNPYLCRLSEIFTHAEKTLPIASTDTRALIMKNSNEQLTNDLITSYLVNTQSNASFTRVSQINTENYPTPDFGNETSRFEYTEVLNNSDANFDNNTFNLSKLLSSLPKYDLTHLQDDEEITCSPIVIHKPCANSINSSFMSLLLEKIDQVLNTYNSSSLFSKEEAQNIDEKLRNDLQSLKNNEKDLEALSQSVQMRTHGVVLNQNIFMKRNQNVLAEMLSDMVVSYLNDSHNMTMRKNYLDSTKLPEESVMIKKEFNTPDVTGIFEPECSMPLNIIKNNEFPVNNEIESVSNPMTLLKDNKENICNNLHRKNISIGNSVRKVKKLLDTNLFPNETLPGSDQSPIKMTRKERYDQAKNTPNLFKPKEQASKVPATQPKKLAGLSTSETPADNKTTLSKKLGNLIDEPVKSPFAQIKKEIKSEQIDRLVNKTNTLSKKLFKKSNKLGKSLNVTSKKHLIAHLNLKTNKLAQIKETIQLLNDFTEVATSHQKHFNTSTTHLVLDFEETFEKNAIDLKVKLIVILAAVNKCKIIRHEWMNHSFIKQRWLEETKYLLENYLGEKLDEYAETDFDVQVVRLIRKTDCKAKLFAGEKKIFLIKERTDLGKGGVISDDEDVEFFYKKSTLQTYLSQIIQKYGGEITCKFEEADLIVALDKTNDYDQTNEAHQKRIEMDQRYFVGCIYKLKKLLTKGRVNVISSEWIFDCILDDKLLPKNNYNLITLEPE